MEKHTLKRPSSFIVVVLRSLRHGSCVSCGHPIRSFEASLAHWEKALPKDDPSKQPNLFSAEQ